MLKFKEMFPEWHHFKQFLIDYSFYYDKDLYTDQRVLVYYTLLYRNFANSHTAYDNEVFLEMLSLTIGENFREFFIVRHLLDKVANSSDEDLIMMLETVDNIAENPNVVTDADSLVNYIGTQHRSKTRSNIIDRIHTLIPRIYIPEIMREVAKYEYLFLKIIPRRDWIYEDDEE